MSLHGARPWQVSHWTGEGACSTRLQTFQGTRITEGSVTASRPTPSRERVRPPLGAEQGPPAWVEFENDTQTDMLLGIPRSAIRVRRFDDSLNSAIHITYRILLRSSSMHEPRDPPLKVVSHCLISVRSVFPLQKRKNPHMIHQSKLDGSVGLN